MKNILLQLMFITLLFAFVSCGGKKEEAKPIDDKTTEEQDDAFDKLTDEADTLTVTEEAETPKETPKKDEKTTKTDAAPSKDDYTTKPLKGKVVSLAEMAMGNPQKLTQAAAKDLLDRGGLLVFLGEDGKAYFVMNEDGSYASRKLVNYVNAETVGLLGKLQVKDGLNIFIASGIHAM